MIVRLRNSEEAAVARARALEAELRHAQRDADRADVSGEVDIKCVPTHLLDFSPFPTLRFVSSCLVLSGHHPFVSHSHVTTISLLTRFTYSCAS